VKIPVRWTLTWVDGRDVFDIKDVQPNVAIDAARFARPSAPVKK
jgi:outer membrane lipoprotein-sorting protein